MRNRVRIPTEFQGFKTLYLDPPWPHRGGGGKAASEKYLTQDFRDLPQIIRNAPVFKPATFAHMYLWTVNNYIEEGYWLTRQLGFDPITLITWPKAGMGIGHYFRGKTEHMIFGVRGDGLLLRQMHTKRKNFTTLLDMRYEERLIHSQKPVEAYELIEAASPGPYCEMFARRLRPGWTSWGNQL